jgi:hypothetical protein
MKTIELLNIRRNSEGLPDNFREIKESVCQKCGRKIEGPGICAGCAEVTTEVAFPVFVRQVITKAEKAQSLALARIKQADELFNGTPWTVS